jgi:NADH:ubiquinone oxidoreductase subunit 4 (subunit M)
MTIREVFKRASTVFKRASIGIFNRLCKNIDDRNINICFSSVAIPTVAGFLSVFPLFAVTHNPFFSALAATAIIFGAQRPANRWAEWACTQPMP